MATARELQFAGYPVGTVVETIHGNKLRRFDNGWSPLEGAHWDRKTVYSDAAMARNFILKSVRQTGW